MTQHPYQTVAKSLSPLLCRFYKLDNRDAGTGSVDTALNILFMNWRVLLSYNYDMCFLFLGRLIF